MFSTTQNKNISDKHRVPPHLPFHLPLTTIIRGFFFYILNRIISFIRYFSPIALRVYVFRIESDKLPVKMHVLK